MGDIAEQGQDEAVTTADWIKAALLIALIVAAVIVFFMFVIGAGPFCDCGTKPAG